MHEKSDENILIYDFRIKLFGRKPLRIMFKVDEYIRDYNGTKYLLLFGSEEYIPFFIGLNILS